MEQEYHLIGGKVIAISFSDMNLGQKRDEVAVKSEFFSKYYGQFIGVERERTEWYKHVLKGPMLETTDYIELRSFDQLTEEERDQVYNKSSRPYNSIGKMSIINHEYLRLKGVLVDFVFLYDDKLIILSTDDLLKLRWAKIKT